MSHHVVETRQLKHVYPDGTMALQDVSFRVAPLRRRDAEEMIREIRGFPLLRGVRGQAAVDLESLTELLLSVSTFVSECDDVEELDLNPVRLYEHGLLALDARLIVLPQQPAN